MKVNYNYLDREFDAAMRSQVLAAIGRVAERGDFTLGDEVEEFENRFGELVDAQHTVGLSSGTAALDLLLRTAGIGPGDEVIVPSLTFLATVGAVATGGATPVYAEVGTDYLLDPRDAVWRVTPHTKAVIPVHYTGALANVGLLRILLRDIGREDIVIIEDAAQAVGASTFDSRYPGYLTYGAAYSLHPLKNLNVWGDAGFAVTEHEEVASQLRLLRNHGLVDRDHANIFGLNARMSTVQAAVGLTVLKHINVKMGNTRRRSVAFMYAGACEAAKPDVEVNYCHLLPPYEPDDPMLQCRHSYHLWMGRLVHNKDGMLVPATAAERDDYVAYMHERGIDAKVHYPVPAHLQKASIDRFGKVSLPRTESLCDSIVSLPCHPWLKFDEVSAVCNAIAGWRG